MNYEEKYNQTIESIKRIYNQADSYGKELMEKEFPQLRESEDERIKKCIGMCLTDVTEQRFEEFNTTLKDCLAWLEKQGEQKPADKVEPKFKVEKGKWYVCTQTFVLRGKIVIIKGQTYQAEKDNVIKGENGCRFIDRHDGKASDYFRPWTIQDAKDGDVLFDSSTASHEIFIFKNIDEEGNAKCYFAYDSEDGFREGKYHFICSATNCKPATKEQRDLLFQKMKEAGYKWDTKKKELKKDEVIAWIDSLKDRVYPQPKQEWSNEDERIRQCLIRDQEQALDDVRNDKYGHSEIISDLKEMYRERIDWLKSLKLQTHWKPSKEQMGTLNEWLKNHQYDGDSRYCYPIFQSLYNDLKTLI